MREETARLEALRQAEVERARVEVEQRARMEALIKQQEHERSLAHLAQDQHKKRLQRMVAVISVGGVLVLGSTLGIYFGKIKPEAERERVAQAAVLAAQEEEQRKLQEEIAQRDKKMTLLQEQYQNAKNEKERLELLRQMDAISPKTTPGGAVGARHVTAAKPDAPKVKCNKGDPMCSDL